MTGSDALRMKFSPLQLLHSHFIALSIVAREDMEPGVHIQSKGLYPKLIESDLKTIVQLGNPDDEPDPHEFMVRLAVTCSPESGSAIPYRFASRMEGVFLIDHDGPLDERRRLVVINGASMLFGTMREQILTLTSRHKYGPLLLPSLDFRTIGPSKAETPQKEIPKPKRKPKAAAKK